MDGLLLMTVMSPSCLVCPNRLKQANVSLPFDSQVTARGRVKV